MSGAHNGDDRPHEPSHRSEGDAEKDGAGERASGPHRDSSRPDSAHPDSSMSSRARPSTQPSGDWKRGDAAGRGSRGAGRDGGPRRGSDRGAARGQARRSGDERSRGSRRPDGDRDRQRRGPGTKPGSEGGRREQGTPKRDRRADTPTTTQATRTPDPVIDDDVTGRELDDTVREELSSLSAGTAAVVTRHLVMTARLLDEDPELSYQHALAARRRSGRLAVIREASGLAAYAAGRYAEALAEFRAVRRMTGSAEYLPTMADCERGLGRPRRALDLAADPAVNALDVASRIEMAIVAAGARRDLGDAAAAAVSLQLPELRARTTESWLARLRYAYADALLESGRADEAREWFVRAAAADPEDITDAAARALELGGAEPGVSRGM